jgi:hypothetical protein
MATPDSPGPVPEASFQQPGSRILPKLRQTIFFLETDDEKPSPGSP